MYSTPFFNCICACQFEMYLMQVNPRSGSGSVLFDNWTDTVLDGVVGIFRSARFWQQNKKIWFLELMKHGSFCIFAFEETFGLGTVIMRFTACPIFQTSYQTNVSLVNDYEKCNKWHPPREINAWLCDRQQRFNHENTCSSHKIFLKRFSQFVIYRTTKNDLNFASRKTASLIGALLRFLEQ